MYASWSNRIQIKLQVQNGSGYDICWLKTNVCMYIRGLFWIQILLVYMGSLQLDPDPAPRWKWIRI